MFKVMIVKMNQLYALPPKKQGFPKPKIPIFLVLPVNEELKVPEKNVQSVWMHPTEPPPQLIQLLSTEGYGSAGLLMTVLASAGFRPYTEKKVQIYKPEDMRNIKPLNLKPASELLRKR